AVTDEFSHVPSVPVIEGLTLSGALGVVGTGVAASDALRGLLMQLAGLHSPAEVVIAAMASPAEVADLDWLAWLPHTSSPHSPIDGTHLADSTSSTTNLLAQLEAVVQQRLGRHGDRPTPRGPLTGS